MEYPRPLDVGFAIASAIRPFYVLWMYVPDIPDILGMREKARKKAIEAVVMLLIQSAVRGLL
jgi:hypothetical protein